MSQVMAKKIDDLPVFVKALEFWNAVNAILDRPGLRWNRRLWDQISEANDSITSSISGGAGTRIGGPSAKGHRPNRSDLEPDDGCGIRDSRFGIRDSGLAMRG
jgi:hypothetical protein